MKRYQIEYVKILNNDGNMRCEICGELTTEEKFICDRCTKIMEDIIRGIDPDLWKSIDNCEYIYPMIKRVTEGSLRTQDVINSLLKGEND